MDDTEKMIKAILAEGRGVSIDTSESFDSLQQEADATESYIDDKLKLLNISLRSSLTVEDLPTKLPKLQEEHLSSVNGTLTSVVAEIVDEMLVALNKLRELRSKIAPAASDKDSRNEQLEQLLTNYKKELKTAKDDFEAAVNIYAADALAKVNTVQEEDGKLLAAIGMAEDSIQGVDYRAYKCRGCGDEFDAVYNKRFSALVVDGSISTNCNAAIVAGEAYEMEHNGSIIKLEADSVFNEESIVIKNGSHKDPTGINSSRVRNDEFVEFCRAFNRGVLKAFPGPQRKIQVLNIYNVPGGHEYPYTNEIHIETFETDRDATLKKYFDSVEQYDPANPNGQTPDKKSLFFIEVQTLVEYLLKQF